MITQRAVLFGFVGLCFYLIAIVNALPPFYYSLTWLTAGILVSCFGVALLSLFALQCEWSVPGSIVSEWLGHDPTKVLSAGETSSDNADFDGLAGAPGVEIDIANTGTLNKTDIVLEVHLREIRRDEEVMRRFLIEALPSGGRLRTRLPLHDLPRGRYRVEEMRLVGSDVLGLFRLRKRVPSKSASATSMDENRPDIEESGAADVRHDIVVGPAMVAAPDVRAWLRLGGSSGGMDASATLGQGDEVRGTRPYNAGDDLRFVHWKTTARRGELVVREFHRTARNQCVIVWDGADPALSAAKNPQVDEPSLRPRSGDAASPRAKSSIAPPHAVTEFSLRIMASLCRTIIESGQPCAVLRLDGNPLLIPAAARGGGASSTLARVSEALADAEANRTTSLAVALSGWMRDMAPGSGLYLVTAAPSPDLLAAIQTLRSHRSHVAICVIDAAALEATTSLSGTGVGAAQSTLTGADAADTDELTQVEALRAHGVAIVTAPHRETSNEPTPSSASLSEADIRADFEIAAIRAALRELLQGSAQVSSAPTSSPIATRATENGAGGEAKLDLQAVASPLTPGSIAANPSV